MRYGKDYKSSTSMLGCDYSWQK